jgi:flavodoxin I
MARGVQVGPIPVIYASNSGGTRMGAGLIAERLTAAGLTADTVSASHAAPTRVAKAETLVIGSCSWLRQNPDGPKEGQLPEFMEDFMERLVIQPSFRGTNVALFGFGRHEYTHFCGAVDILESMVSRHGGALFVNSLRVDGFFVQNQEAIGSWADALAGSIKDLPQLA